MRVRCIVFDIDGMLFEYYMNFLNIEKNKILRNLFLQNFMFSSRFMLFAIYIFFWCKQIPGGGGGVIEKLIFLLEKQFFSHFTFYAIFNIKKKNIEKCPFTYWLNGRWFLQIVDRDSWNLHVYPLYPLLVPCSDFESQMWGWFGGGGVMFFSHFMLFATFLEKKHLLRRTIISHLMFSSCVFFMLEILKSAPSLTGLMGGGFSK